MDPVPWFEAHCGCIFVPCHRGATQRPFRELLESLVGVNQTNATLPPGFYDAANAPHTDLGGTGGNNNYGTFATPTHVSNTRNADDGSPSSNALIQAQLERRRRSHTIIRLNQRLYRWPTAQEINDEQELSRSSLPALAIENLRAAQQHAELAHLSPSARNSRRRTHAQAFEIHEDGARRHKPLRQRSDTSDRPAPRGLYGAGNYHQPYVEDAPGSSAASQASGSNTQTTGLAGTSSRRAGGGRSHDMNRSDGDTENHTPHPDLSSNAGPRGGASFAGSSDRHHRRNYNGFSYVGAGKQRDRNERSYSDRHHRGKYSGFSYASTHNRRDGNKRSSRWPNETARHESSPDPQPTARHHDTIPIQPILKNDDVLDALERLEHATYATHRRIGHLEGRMRGADAPWNEGPSYHPRPPYASPRFAPHPYLHPPHP